MMMWPLWRWSPPSPLSSFSPSPSSPPSVVSNTAAAAFSATNRKKPLPLPIVAKYMPLPGCQFIETKTTGRWRRPTTKWRICSSTTRSSCSSRSTPTCTLSPCTGMSMRCRAAVGSGRATAIMICAERGGHRRRSAETETGGAPYAECWGYTWRNDIYRGKSGVHPAALLSSPPADSEMIFDACSNLHFSRVTRLPLAMGDA
jgi:hypothetical protein